MAERYDQADVSRARVGALLILIITGVALSVFFLDAIVRATTEGPRITVTTPTAPGVEPGTRVWVAGREVGRVLSVEFTEPSRDRERVEIVAVLDRGVDEIIREDASVTIQPGALLAPVVIVIDPGTGALPPRDIARAFTTAEEGVDPDALLEMSATLRESGDSLRASADRLRSAIRSGGGTLAALAGDPDVLTETGRRMREARAVLDRDYPEGSLAKLAADTLIAERLNRIRERVAVLDTLDAQDRAVRSFQETSSALEAFGERLRALQASLDSGEGSAGRWLQDGQIASQVALLRARVDSLATEMTRRPDRWLRVKVF